MALLVALALALVTGAHATVEQIRITLTGVQGEMLVSWSTPREDNASSLVKVGSSSGRYDVGTFSGSASTYTLGDYTSGDLHFVTVQKLKPNTRYFYVCGDEQEWSREHSFVTPHSEAVPVSIGMIGDIGQTLNSETTGKAMASDPKGLDLIMHVGDLSYANGNQTKWDRWGRLFEYIAARVPWMVIPGNHEIEAYAGVPFTSYQARFKMPYEASGGKEGNLYWSMDYSWIHFVAISTESTFEPGSEMYQWFINDMEAVDRSKTPWVVVMFHRPFYNTNEAHQGEVPTFRPAFEPLFKKYCVDLIFSGHVHAYERIHPVYNNVVGDGPMYFTIGDAGNKEGLAATWKERTSWSALRKAAYGYVRMDVYNETHIEYSWFANEYEFFSLYRVLGVPTPLERHTASDHIWIVKEFPRNCNSVE